MALSQVSGFDLRCVGLTSSVKVLSGASRFVNGELIPSIVEVVGFSEKYAPALSKLGLQ